ncbi:MAG TPA: DNA repair protein RecO [Vicinamibacteria bacterium]|nr:DNA repair protein RecO [Vicinamibacteria bacterium]
MPLLNTEALVLRGYKLGETSKVVVLLTRERGKLRAVARGARSGRPRFQSALEPLSQIRATLYGREGAELLRLGQAELLHSAFRAGARSLESALALLGCAELLDAFCPDGFAEEKVYRLALAVVRAAEQGATPDLLSRYLEAWLLRLHGLHPSLERCARCGRALASGPLSYDRAAQGFVCEGCRPASGPVLSAAAAELLAELFHRPPESFERQPGPESAEIESFHRDRVAEHLERELRGPRVIREARREAR